MHLFRKTMVVPSAGDALPGRPDPIPTPNLSFLNGRSIKAPFPDGTEQAQLGLGCFWGGEKAFWSLPGVYVTAVGYAAGVTPNPTYEEVCSGRTGHNEVVLVVFDPERIGFDTILETFWEAHDPTQGMRQGNDVGTQYRSGIYTCSEAQSRQAFASRDAYQEVLSAAGHGRITTEILGAGPFYHAEGCHQQYLVKNPFGYCGHGGTGVPCPVGVTARPTVQPIVQER